LTTLTKGLSIINNDDETVYIYALIDPRDERVRYVGQAVNPARRYRDHLAQKNTSTRKRDWIDELILLGLAPIIKVIEQCQKGNVDKREIHWIAHHRNLNTDLLNVLDGGAWQGLWAHTDETKKKISDARKGRTFTEETRKKISDGLKGRTLTDETKKRISDAKKGKSNPRSQIPIAQYTLDGIFIQQFPSGKEASEKTGILASNISMCVNNNTRSRHAGGYQWKKVIGGVLMIIEPVRPRSVNKILMP